MATLKIQAQTLLPTRNGDFIVMAVSDHKENLMPHIVLLKKGTDLKKTVNVRVHSECMTGDVFGSYKCECGEQLEWALDYIGRNMGLLIYLRQEGRGIGLINKIQAYAMQQEGFDTAEANKLLGFEYDERSYEDAISIIRDLEIKEINLLTNNPDKISALDNCIIKIKSIVPIEITPRKENVQYLITKKNFFGHKLKHLEDYLTAQGNESTDKSSSLAH